MNRPIPEINFRDASRAQAKASILIEGLSGKGKSGLSLMLGYVLSGEDWSGVFAADTENRSLDLFQGIATHVGGVFEPFSKFDITRVHGFRPSIYEAVMHAAIKNGAKAFIADSITHAWQGKGGVLEIQAEKQGGDPKKKYTAWGDPEVVAEKEAMYALMRSGDVHCIHTVRVKEKFEIGDGKMISVGEQQMQMPDLKFEPDLVLHMLQSGSTEGRPPKARVVKSRYAILIEGETYEFSMDLMRQLRSYLAEGVDPAELMEAQRQEYIRELQSILDNNTSKRTMWGIIKADKGWEDVTLDQMNLMQVRQMYTELMN